MRLSRKAHRCFATAIGAGGWRGRRVRDAWVVVSLVQVWLLILGRRAAVGSIVVIRIHAIQIWRLEVGWQVLVPGASVRVELRRRSSRHGLQRHVLTLGDLRRKLLGKVDLIGTAAVGQVHCPCGLALALTHVPVGRGRVRTRERGHHERRVLLIACEHPGLVLLQQVIIRQLLRVGVRRDTVHLDQLDPRDVVIEHLHSAHVALARTRAKVALGPALKRIGVDKALLPVLLDGDNVAVLEDWQDGARVHHRDLHVLLEPARLSEHLALQLA